MMAFCERRLLLPLERNLERRGSCCAAILLSLSSLGLALVLGLSGGCATTTQESNWQLWLNSADRHFADEEWSQAEALYGQLLAEVPEGVWPADKAEVEIRRARCWAALGERERALAALEAIGARAPVDLEGAQGQARAILTKARLLAEMGEADAALSSFVRVVVAWPESALAPTALEQVLRRFDAHEDRQGAIDWLEAARAQVGEGAIVDNMVYALAELYRFDGNIPMAKARLGELRLLGLQSAFFDDATWVLAELEEDRELKLALLEELAGAHDSSWALGDYDSLWRDDAMLRRAEIFAAHGDVAAALTEYRRVEEAYPGSLSAIEAAQAAAALLRAEGRVVAYGEALKAIIEDYPDSVAAERATLQLQLVNEGRPLAEIPDRPRLRP